MKGERAGRTHAKTVRTVDDVVVACGYGRDYERDLAITQQEVRCERIVCAVYFVSEILGRRDAIHYTKVEVFVFPSAVAQHQLPLNASDIGVRRQSRQIPSNQALSCV